MVVVVTGLAVVDVDNLHDVSIHLQIEVSLTSPKLRQLVEIGLPGGSPLAPVNAVSV